MQRNTVAAAVVAAALGLGALVMVLHDRDTGPSIVPSKPPAVTLPAKAKAPRPQPVEPSEPPMLIEVDELPDLDGPQPHPPAKRLDGPGSPIDPDQTFTGDIAGIAAAALSRTDRFVDCLDAVRLADPEDEGYGRLVLEVTVAEDGTGDARVITGPDDAQTQTCMGRVMADARFEAPEAQQSVVWTVPLPEPVVEPDDEPAEPAEPD
ncbi:MAG: hypothetical protein R3F59_34115 [Myxococcota bacterium]